MDVKVKQGIVAFKGIKYKKDEVIRGIDKPTTNYLLSMNVVEKMEVSLDAFENITKNNSVIKRSKKKQVDK